MASPFVELEIEGRTVKVTNSDKVFYRKLKATKLDHVQYYVSVAEGIVRALYERPTQLKRHPDGAEGEAIYQKRVPEKRPEWIETARVTSPVGTACGRALRYRGRAGRLGAANLATIDFHPWPSRRAHVDNLDELRIDVDPQPGTTFKDAKKVAPRPRGAGRARPRVGPRPQRNRGIHIACRIEPNWTFPEVPVRSRLRAGGRRLPKVTTACSEGGARASRLHRLQPERARPDDRLAYSVRARLDATVSAPVTWDELADVETEDFTADDAEALRQARRRAGANRRSARDPRKLFAVERDEKEGIGEAAYPPQFPKMPGEERSEQPPEIPRGRPGRPSNSLLHAKEAAGRGVQPW